MWISYHRRRSITILTSELMICWCCVASSQKFIIAYKTLPSLKMYFYLTLMFDPRCAERCLCSLLLRGSEEAFIQVIHTYILFFFSTLWRPVLNKSWNLTSTLTCQKVTCDNLLYCATNEEGMVLSRSSVIDLWPLSKSVPLIGAPDRASFKASLIVSLLRERGHIWSHRHFDMRFND